MTNALPKEFWERIQKIYSQDDIEIIKKGFSIKSRKPSFRVNTIKSSNEEVEAALKASGLKVSKVNYIDHCYVLENGREKDLWDLEIFKEGKIYLQQIASQIPVSFMNLKIGDRVLDTTAAPGSKTSQITDKLANSGEIIANELNSIRIDKLKFTLDRQGVTNTKILKGDARKLSSNLKETYNIDSLEYFDHILFDAPCSAEGRINLNKEKSYGFWKENMFKKHYRLSKQILDEIIPTLKVGGELVFSTCTIAPEENEGIVHYLLCNHPELELIPISIDFEYCKPGITKFGKYIYKNEVKDTIRCLPSEVTEGFYIAKFRKKAQD